MVVLAGFCFLRRACRTFATSNPNLTRFSSRSSVDVSKVGMLLPQKNPNKHYLPGQLFVHTVFAYRGIILCSFDCKVYNKPKVNEAIESQETLPYYQVLIHKDDWDTMGFAWDMTSYLTQATNRSEKIMNNINGMDCVAHNEILPYCLEDEIEEDEKPAIDHKLFDRFFEPVTTEHPDQLNYKLFPELIPHQIVNNSLWLVPQAVYKETTEGIEVQVVTYYLGLSTSKDIRVKTNCWRYVIRIVNLMKRPVILRERNMKVFSLNSLTQVSGNGMDGKQTCLTSQCPAYQYSSHVYLQQPKGGHLWGKLKLEREDGTIFEVTVPTVQLENTSETTVETGTENGIL